MSYPIRQRPATLALLVRTLIRGGLEAMIDAINADLAAATAPYRLPPYGDTGDLWGDDNVTLRLQEPEIPGGLSYPHIRVVPMDASSRQDASSRSGRTEQSLAVAAFIDAAALDASREVAAPTAQAADEQALALAAMDLANAVGRILRAPSGGVFSSAAGSVQIVVDRVQRPRIHQVPASDVRAIAAWIVLEIRVVIEETY